MYFNKKSIMAIFMAVSLVAPAIYAAPGEEKPKSWLGGLSYTQLAVPVVSGCLKGWFITEPRLRYRSNNRAETLGIGILGVGAIAGTIDEVSNRVFDWTIRDDHRAVDALHNTPLQLDVTIEDPEQRIAQAEMLHELDILKAKSGILDKKITSALVNHAAMWGTIIVRFLLSNHRN